MAGDENSGYAPRRCHPANLLNGEGLRNRGRPTAATERMKSNSAKLGFLLGIALSAGLLLYLLSGLEWGVFFREIERVNLWYIIPLFAAHILAAWLRAKRWHYLVPGGKSIRTGRLWNGVSIGNLATYALPLRAGEFIRPWVLSRRKEVSFAAAFASIVTERVFDVLTMLALLGLCLSQIENPPQLVTVGARLLGVGALGILGVMVFTYFQAGKMIALCEWVCRRVFARFPALTDKILYLAHEFVSGLKAITSWTDLVVIIFWSFALWIECALIYHLVLLAFGEHPSLWVSQVLNVIIALAIAVPSAPGFLGTFQFGCVTALTGIYHYSQEFSMAYSVFQHSLQVIFTVITGTYALRSEGLRFGELKKSRETSTAAEEGNATPAEPLSAPSA